MAIRNLHHPVGMLSHRGGHGEKFPCEAKIPG